MISAARDQPWFPYSGRRSLEWREPAYPVQLIDCEVSYPEATRPVFAGLSLTIQSAQWTSVIGPNGSGKSTLLKLIAGLLHPASGQVRVFGQKPPCGWQLAYLPQRSEIDWSFPISVEQMVATGRYVHAGWLKRLGRSDRQRVDECLERVGLESLRRGTIQALSGGQQQRMLLARALVQEAELLLLDEPLAAVDQQSKAVINDLLTEHVRAGGTAMVTTHELSNSACAAGPVVDLGCRP
jgi:manganese/zinc/iron transport system ATP- binding protein